MDFIVKNGVASVSISDGLKAMQGNGSSDCEYVYHAGAGPDSGIDTQSKFDWVGRQIKIIREKGEEGKKIACANAKQMAKFFVTPDEKEVLKFFIIDGSGDGNGDKNESDKPKQAGGSRPGGMSATDQTPSAQAAPWFEHQFKDESSDADNALLLETLVPQDHPSRNTYSGRKLESEELYRALRSAYGPGFWVLKDVENGGVVTFVDDMFHKGK